MIVSDKKAQAFQKKCLKIDEDVFFVDDDGPDNEYEDDGALHILRHNLRAVFDVSHGQRDTAAEQNNQVRRIMEGLGMKGKISDSVLTEEDEDEDEEERCQCCGRPT